MNGMNDSDKQSCIVRCAHSVALQVSATKRLCCVCPVVRMVSDVGPQEGNAGSLDA
jgi:hypothetical protein